MHRSPSRRMVHVARCGLPADHGPHRLCHDKLPKHAFANDPEGDSIQPRPSVPTAHMGFNQGVNMPSARSPTQPDWNRCPAASPEGLRLFVFGGCGWWCVLVGLRTTLVRPERPRQPETLPNVEGLGPKRSCSAGRHLPATACRVRERPRPRPKAACRTRGPSRARAQPPEPRGVSCKHVKPGSRAGRLANTALGEQPRCSPPKPSSRSPLAIGTSRATVRDPRAMFTVAPPSTSASSGDRRVFT
ncbi:Hypothetical protein ACGLYG10_1105 [Actinomyces glycerinitolerans]|uniref:Uncharacterized protein n=1 Tax=Actinomyces glycerinitolerans TaxID=1892869 RepID=A0A1M4RY25_9ACTO|nr:Hypothetical protein ACGLYG10_1105 [Actinomyces glycerinitolerans]